MPNSEWPLITSLRRDKNESMTEIRRLRQSASVAAGLNIHETERRANV
jgi:hypothetical protein